jgi:hypothetical protein
VLNTSIQKTFIFLIAFFLFFAHSIVNAQADILEDFSGFSGSKFSDDHWKSRNGDPSKVYSFLTEDKNVFMRGHDHGNSVQLFRKKGWKISDNPVLSWKWRVIEFPKNSNIEKIKNDSAVGIYVVFPARWFVPEAIKYVWSEKMETGTVIRKKENFPTMVIRSGNSGKGKWVLEQRDVLADYEKLFKRRPSDPVAFGFLTDSNNTSSESIGDYDDFIVLPKIKSQPSTEASNPVKTESVKKAEPVKK